MENDNTSDIAVMKRIFDIVQHTLEFLIVFIRIILELCISLVQLFIPKKLKDVSKEIVLITGTGHGIGRELALHYTVLGSTVICIDINEKNNEVTVKKAKRLNAGSVYSYTCDVTDRNAVLQLADRIKNEIGLVSVLVNNVGIMPTHPFEQQTADEIRQVFEINVFSQFWTLQAFLPHMKQQNHGHITAMSSIAGLVGNANVVPYCASKFAVRGLMEALHEETRTGPYKNKITGSVIYPYMTNTGLCKKPIIKFPSVLGLLDPKVVAEHIVEAHRANIREVTIPSSLLYINNWCRVLPVNCALLLKDFIGGGLGSDL
uniref:Short-chain dehydrogenase/reductase 3 n=1 Tax=Glossina brevipalpis TaxID=37001 RepID=A0A1A9WKW5_9MUSC